MKRIVWVAIVAISVLSITACGRGKGESAASIAQKWCDLNGKAHKAEGVAKEAAEAAVEKFENEIEEKYKDKKGFMEEVEKEAEKCEDASEGR